MKKKTLLGVAAAAAVGAAGWYLAAGGRKNQIEHIRLLAVRRDELAALRSAAEAGELDAGALGPVPLDGAALESVRMEDGAAVLALRGEKAAAQPAKKEKSPQPPKQERVPAPTPFHAPPPQEPAPPKPVVRRISSEPPRVGRLVAFADGRRRSGSRGGQAKGRPTSQGGRQKPDKKD